jgi:hypothetical protein
MEKVKKNLSGETDKIADDMSKLVSLARNDISAMIHNANMAHQKIFAMKDWLWTLLLIYVACTIPANIYWTFHFFIKPLFR